jgi:hypothetical protein
MIDEVAVTIVDPELKDDSIYSCIFKACDGTSTCSNISIIYWNAVLAAPLN